MSERPAQLFTSEIRVRLLIEYADEPTSPSKVAERLGKPVNLISYHTNVLERHGCVELVRRERRRGATEHYYRATGAPLIEDQEWARLPPRLRRALIRGTLGAAIDEAKAAATDGGFDDAHAHVNRTLLRLDAEGVGALSRLLRGVVDDVARIEAASRTRASQRNEPYEVVVLSFRRGSAP